MYKFTDEGKTLSYIPDGTYILGATFPGYTYAQQPQAFQTTLPSTIVNLALAPNQVGVTVAVTSTLGSASDLTGATMTLTPVTPAGPPRACGSSLLVPGFGVAQSVAVSSGQAAFTQVVPDVYTLGGSDPGHPPQTGTQLTVCPDGSTSPSPAAFEFQEGEVGGPASTVSVPTGSGLLASGVTLNLYTGTSTGGNPQVLTVTCQSTSTNCTTGTFSAFVALGSQYTVQAVMTGLTTDTHTTPLLTASKPVGCDHRPQPARHPAPGRPHRHVRR